MNTDGGEQQMTCSKIKGTETVYVNRKMSLFKKTRLMDDFVNVVC